MLKEGEIRIPSGCAIAAIIDRKGNRINGSEIIKSIALMHDRSNGLGGGFAAYGIYPEHKTNTQFTFSMILTKQKNNVRIFFLGISILMLLKEYLPVRYRVLKKDLIFGDISARLTVFV